MLDLKKLTHDRLTDLFMKVQDEMRVRALTEVEDPVAAIRGQDEAKRALLIAAAGHHSILFVGPHQTGKTMFMAAAAKLGVTSFELLPCPCGFLKHPQERCRCPDSVINIYWLKNKHGRLLGEVDMLVELPAMSQFEIEASPLGTSLADITAALRKMACLPDFDKATEESAKVLLRHSIKESRLLPGVVATIKRLSATIAAVEQSPSILAQHVSEAIMYRPSLNRITG